MERRHDLVVDVVLDHVGDDRAVAGLHLAPPLDDLLGVHVGLERGPHALRDVLALGVVEHVFGALADFLGVGEHPVDEVAELGASHRRACTIRGGDALAAGARPARHQLVALVAVGQHDRPGLRHDALAVDHPEADGPADPVAVLEQVDDLDAVLEAHAQLAGVLGHIQREVLVEDRQAPRMLGQPAHVLGLAGVVADRCARPSARGARGSARDSLAKSSRRSWSSRKSPTLCDVEVEDVVEAVGLVHEDDVAAALVGLAAPAGDDLVEDEHVDLGVGLLGADGAGQPAMPPPTISRSADSTVPRYLERRHLTPPPASRCRRSRARP